MSVADAPVIGPELRFEELCVSRGGRRVLHDVSLAIPPGEKQRSVTVFVKRMPLAIEECFSLDD